MFTEIKYFFKKMQIEYQDVFCSFIKCFPIWWDIAIWFGKVSTSLTLKVRGVIFHGDKSRFKLKSKIDL